LTQLMHESIEQSVENGPESTLEKRSRLPVIEAAEPMEGVEEETETTTTQQSAEPMEEVEEKKTDNGVSVVVETKKKKTMNGENQPSSAVPSAPPPPVMKGTLSCDIDQRRHLIRGMWNYENSNDFPPQPFELVCNLPPEEDKEVLPRDGEFHGSFRLAYSHLTSKGKKKDRVKVIPETGVNIKFTETEKEGDYKVDGKGTNQFGIFHIYGTATKSHIEGDNTLHVVLRKRYASSEQPPTAAAAGGASTETTIRKGPISPSEAASEAVDTGPLPEPAKSYASGVVCLQGKVYKEESADLGLDEVVHRINGMWSSGLDFILGDPQNVRGLCNRFEYEHKSSTVSQAFPVSGRYSGWFDLSNEDGTRTRINERDVTLKFRKNNQGCHNVEGKGSNVFGKYSITGTLTADNVITIFRHFQARKLKSNKATTPASTPVIAISAAAGAAAAAATTSVAPRPSVTNVVEPKLKIDDIKVNSKDPVDPITPPSNGAYSAVSRGVLRVNGDGSHSCQGKWAVTREHFTNNQTSNFNFRLESHFATEAQKQIDGVEPRQFPLDSAMYKGSFQLKKLGSRYQTIVDQQVVMKFCENNQGSYNVYGKGINAIGEFNLIGTMVMSGKTGGQVELYRMYPPEKLTAQPPATKTVTPAPVDNGTIKAVGPTPGPGLVASAAGPAFPGPLTAGMQRRESTRTVKLPSRLEDDDPTAQLSRIMEKCSQILRIIRERDAELGAFFAEQVDPVALGIPTYYQVIKQPMDLRSIQRKMDSQQVTTPEDFARHVRLVFENAMTFNVDPAHSVHQAARSLLVLFNQKFRDVDRMSLTFRRASGGEWDESGKKRGKDDKKRRRQSEEIKSLKRQRLEEAQAMAADNATAVAAIVAAAPSTNAANVTRSEFSMLLHLIQQLQKQVVQTHTALADLCPGDENDVKTGMVSSATFAPGSATYLPLPTAATPLSETKKKPIKRKAPEPQMESPAYDIDDSYPLSHAEQELLTETINELPPEHLGGIIQIIREAAPVGADEDEIDLEIDQLDTKTQRKLQAHVSQVRCQRHCSFDCVLCFLSRISFRSLR
jgi:hypothetical protein